MLLAHAADDAKQQSGTHAASADSKQIPQVHCETPRCFVKHVPVPTHLLFLFLSAARGAQKLF